MPIESSKYCQTKQITKILNEAIKQAIKSLAKISAMYLYAQNMVTNILHTFKCYK